MDAPKGNEALGWAEPAIVAAAFVLPGLVPAFAASAGSGPAGAAGWLISGTVQSLSQFALLSIIIGARGKLREYGLCRPKARDPLRAAALAAILFMASKLAALAFGGEGASAAVPDAGGWPFPALIALSALFSASVGYREELFYRLYVIGSLRDRGASPEAAALASAALFAAGHAYQGAAGIAAAAAVGLVLAAATVRGWRLHSLALAHAAYDFAVLWSVFAVP